MTIFDHSHFERKFTEELAAIRLNPKAYTIPPSYVIDLGRASNRKDNEIREALRGAGLPPELIDAALANPRKRSQKRPAIPLERTFAQRMIDAGVVRLGDPKTVLRAFSPIPIPKDLDEQLPIFLDKLYSDWRYRLPFDEHGPSPAMACANPVLPDDPTRLASLRNCVLTFPEMDTDRLMRLALGAVCNCALPLVAILCVTNTRFKRAFGEIVVRFSESGERIPGRQPPCEIVYEGPVTEGDMDHWRDQYAHIVRLLASSNDPKDRISLASYDPRTPVHLPGRHGEWTAELLWLGKPDPTDRLF